LFNWIHNPYVQIAYTWIPTAEATSAFRCLPLSDGSISTSCPGGVVYGSKPGNRLPYAPENLLTAKIGYAHPIGFDVSLEAVFTDQQFGDFMNLESGFLPGALATGVRSVLGGRHSGLFSSSH
jgi:Fe(3+) dicitrate transport protein